MPIITRRSPLECWRGTRPNQAARWRPFLKSEPSPIAAIIAVAVFGPIPRILAILWQTSLALKIAVILRSKALIRSSICNMNAYRLETISRSNSVSSSLGAARIFGINRRARAIVYRRADRLGVVGIVLLPAHERLHVLRGHNLHGVTELLELPLPIECTSRGFDADKAPVLQAP